MPVGGGPLPLRMCDPDPALMLLIQKPVTPKPPPMSINGDIWTPYESTYVADVTTMDELACFEYELDEDGSPKVWRSSQQYRIVVTFTIEDLTQNQHHMGSDEFASRLSVVLGCQNVYFDHDQGAFLPGVEAVPELPQNWSRPVMVQGIYNLTDNNRTNNFEFIVMVNSFGTLADVKHTIGAAINMPVRLLHFWVDVGGHRVTMGDLPTVLEFEIVNLVVKPKTAMSKGGVGKRKYKNIAPINLMTQVSHHQGGYLQAGNVSVLGMKTETLVAHVHGLCSRLSLPMVRDIDITNVLDEDGFVLANKRFELINEAVVCQALHPDLGMWFGDTPTDRIGHYAEQYSRLTTVEGRNKDEVVIPNLVIPFLRRVHGRSSCVVPVKPGSYLLNFNAIDPTFTIQQKVSTFVLYPPPPPL